MNDYPIQSGIAEIEHPQIVTTDKVILDACCGGRMFWFDKQNPNALYVDIRTAKKGHIPEAKNHQVEPDLIADFRQLPFQDNQFKHIVWDPPHSYTLGKNSIMAKKYGSLQRETWPYDLSKGFSELWRCLDDYGTLVFKWSEPNRGTNITLEQVLKLFKQRPLYGHPSGKSKTMWCVFMKIPEARS